VKWFPGDNAAWVKEAAGIHGAVPWVHLVLIVLSVLVAIETVIAIAGKKKAALAKA